MGTSPGVGDCCSVTPVHIKVLISAVELGVNLFLVKVLLQRFRIPLALNISISHIRFERF
jgi:hypothetical protein